MSGAMGCGEMLIVRLRWRAKVGWGLGMRYSWGKLGCGVLEDGGLEVLRWPGGSLEIWGCAVLVMLGYVKLGLCRWNTGVGGAGE